MWFAGDLATGCGGQGIGTWKSPDGQNWTVCACAHSNSADDRESMWVDNSPYSAAYGRMYISLNNFNVRVVEPFSLPTQTTASPGALRSQLTNGSTFIRDVQITGTLPGQIPPVCYLEEPGVCGRHG